MMVFIMLLAAFDLALALAIVVYAVRDNLRARQRRARLQRVRVRVPQSAFLWEYRPKQLGRTRPKHGGRDS